jgi:hypothetical protein
MHEKAETEEEEDYVAPLTQQAQRKRGAKDEEGPATQSSQAATQVTTAHMHTYVHTYMHTHIYTHIHIYFEREVLKKA